jgi:ribosome biogenesis GTPase
MFAEALARLGGSGGQPARVVAANRGSYRLVVEKGECEASLTGRFRHKAGPAGWPVTGDWVVLRGEPPRIDAVLPRSTCLSRKAAGRAPTAQVLAANVDVAFIVAGLDHDFNLRRLERYLVLANESRVVPVLILNKTDLVNDAPTRIGQVREIAGSVAVIGISAINGAGIELLDAHIRARQTAVLVGSSGTGKSTILNSLLGTDVQRIAGVRIHDSRGRHTTTGRELFLLPHGWLLMDTPGLRELQLRSDEAAVERGFTDIAALAARCRFRDCKHNGEPGCAVAGAIDKARLRSYRKLSSEAGS